MRLEEMLRAQCVSDQHLTAAIPSFLEILKDMARIGPLQIVLMFEYGQTSHLRSIKAV